MRRRWTTCSSTSSRRPTTPTFAGIPIYVDPLGLQEAERSLNSTVTMDLEGVPLKTTLKLMLKQLGLAYTVKDGFLMVTSEDSEDQQTEIRVYPVADLAIIPMSLMMGGGGWGHGRRHGRWHGRRHGRYGRRHGRRHGRYGRRHGRRHEGGMGGGMMSVPPVDPQVPAGDRRQLSAKKKVTSTHLKASPPANLRQTPRASRHSPAGPSSLSRSRDDGPTIRSGSSGAGQKWRR